MADPVVLPSAVQSVNVFRAGAVITRTAALAAAGVTVWPDEVAFDGLPLALLDDSVRVAVVAGPGTLPDSRRPKPADVRVTLVVPKVGEPIIPPSEKEVQAASDEVVRLQAKIARIHREIEQHDRIYLQLAEPFEHRPPRPAPAAAWTGVIEWVQKDKRARVDEKSKLEDDLARAREALARLQRRDAEARASRDTSKDAVRKRVVIRLRGVEGVSLDPSLSLALEYQVPGARWVPTYVFRMGRDGRAASLAVRALVVQATGESWDRVKLSVSTADLLRETEMPELKSLRIGRKQPEPPKRAWRDPPTGSELLFQGLDNALSTMRPPPPVAPPANMEPMPLPPPPFQPAPMEPEPDALSTRSGGFGGAASLERGDGGRRRSESTGNRKQDRAPGAPPPAPPKSIAMPVSAAPAPMPMTTAPTGAAGPVTGSINKPMARPAQRASRAPAREEMADQKERAKSAPPFDAPVLDMESSASFADEEGSLMGGLAADGLLAPAGIAPDDGVLRYADLKMTGWGDSSGHERGKLRPVTILDQLALAGPEHAPQAARQMQEASNRAQTVIYMTFPPETTDVGASSGAFDHRYDAEGLVDVPGDGKIHSVPLFVRRAPVATTLIVVPRESTQAVRVAEMKNPLAAPLLAGPAEIYLEDEFLVTSPIRTVPSGAELRVGLGVEEALKVARNTHFDEEAHGLLGGGATLHHRVEIEIASRLAAPVKVEVRERIPIKEELDKEVEIIVPDAVPPFEVWDQADTNLIKGGRRWRLTLGAGESKKLNYSYLIKIDGKNEVAGGNRRE